MPLPIVHLSYYSGCSKIGLHVINTCFDIYAQMGKTKLTGKACPPNKDIQWSSPLFSLWNMKARLGSVVQGILVPSLLAYTSCWL